MSLENNLVTYLEGEATILALIGNGDSPETIRLYPLIMPQNTTMPAVVYQRVTGERIHHLSGVSGRATPSIQFDIYSDSYSEAKSVADALRGVLDGYQGIAGAITVDSTLLIEELDGFDDETDYYRIMQEYKFSHLE